MSNQEHSAQTQSSIKDLTRERATESNAIQIPQISLPKGGGALKGIDEKFEVNAANGTASLSIPLPITPGRGGFQPDLSLSYNSGGGNGPFGLGWSLALPGIQRRSDKKLPRYQGHDTFILSGAEDLVPCLKRDEAGDWQPVTIDHDSYHIERYRPRIEGLFARIEKVTLGRQDVYWRVTTRDNVTTFYGRNPHARIFDPEDESKIFSWLPEFTFDNLGNCMVYAYKSEDLVNVPNLLSERNRHNGLAPFTNRYLKNVKYGNHRPYFADPNLAYDLQPHTDARYFFELVFDYGEHTNLLLPHLRRFRLELP